MQFWYYNSSSLSAIGLFYIAIVRLLLTPISITQLLWANFIWLPFILDFVLLTDNIVIIIGQSIINIYQKARFSLCSQLIYNRNQMSLRYGKFKDYVKSYTSKTKDYRAKLKNYIKAQRQSIIARERQKLRKRLVFWTIFLGGGFLIYDEIYRKKVQINKMNKKLQNFYAKNMVKETLKQGVHCLILLPNTLDELANMMSLAYKYHYKTIIRMDQITKREKIIIAEKFDNKCIFLNISALNKVKVDEINQQIYVQAGAKCSQINLLLEQHGFQPIFPAQFHSERIYDIIIKNLPLINQDLNSSLTNMELISSSGIHFRSAGQTNRYGEIPSLNPLFIGTGGIFAIPTAANIKIHKKQQTKAHEQTLLLKIGNFSEKIDALRKFKAINTNLIDIKLSNLINNEKALQNIYITCKEKYPLRQQNLNPCSKIANESNIPITKAQNTSSSPNNFNLFFNINHSIFQEFLLTFNKQFAYQYTNGLLKVGVNNVENQEEYLSIINNITNNNGIFVWCDIPQILMRIKPSLDSSQVGAELMRKIVQVRQGLDPRNILYAHNRYQSYFAKGFFRKLTEYFW